MESMSEIWISFGTDFILGKRKKSDGGQIGKYGGVPKLQCFFLRKTDDYSGLYEQMHYRDGAPMPGFPKGSASCHTLFLRGAEESFYKWFGSLFGLEVGIRNEKRFFGCSIRYQQIDLIPSNLKLLYDIIQFMNDLLTVR